MRFEALLLAALVSGAAAQTTETTAKQPEGDKAAAQATDATTAPASQAPRAAADAADAATSPDKADLAPPRAAKLDPYTADLADLQRAGYVIKKHNGETLYCRKDPETGSRVRKNTFCLTRDQLMQIDANTRDAMREMTRDTSPKGD